jgi:CBS domain-containing protein
MSTSLRETLREKIEELRSLRDQVRVDLKLAGMELRSEWRELERRMPDAARTAEDFKSVTVEAMERFLSDVRRFRSRIESATVEQENTVASMMTRDVAFCSPRSSLAEAARLMWEHDVGCLPVVEEDCVVAVVTDRDACMSAYIQGQRLDQIEVRSAMSRNLYTCGPEAKPDEVEAIMIARQVRRVPVVDGQGRLQGILTVSDLARRAVAAPESGGAAGEAPGAVGVTLAAIVAPRTDTSAARS